MNDPLLMRVLDCLADRHEQFQSLARRQPAVIAELDDRHPVDQLHDEKGPATLRRSHIEDPGNVLVVHHRQRLPFGLETSNDLLAVHARLDDLERDLALDGLRLLGHVNDAHAPFADLLEQLVGTDPRPHSLGQQPLAQDRSRGGERMRQKTSELPDVRDSPANGLGRDERLRQKTSELLLLGKQTF